MLLGAVEYFTPMAHKSFLRKPTLSTGGNVQKTCPRGGGESAQQGRNYFAARSVLSVREHGTMARTPLAAFFNIPSIYILAPDRVQRLR